MASKNTYNQDERLDEPFDIRHLLLASAYIKKYIKQMGLALFLSILLSIVCFTSACQPLRAEQILGKKAPEPVSETGKTGADPGTADGLFVTCGGDGDGSSADRETGPVARTSPAGFSKQIRPRGSGMRIQRAS